MESEREGGEGERGKEEGGERGKRKERGKREENIRCCLLNNELSSCYKPQN